MEQNERQRQHKIDEVIQQELAEMLQGSIRNQGVSNLMISVTKVQVTADLSVAKVYLSIFPSDQAQSYLNNIKENSIHIRHDLSQRMKNQLRRVPNLHFYLDDSLDYIDKIDQALKTQNDPIKHRETLTKRQKK